MQLLAMEGEPLDEDPSLLQASKSRALLNPLPVSPPAHLLHRPFHAPFTEPPETLTHPFSVSFAPQQFPSADSHKGKLPSQQRRNGELKESDEDKQHYSQEGKEEKNKGGSLHYRGGNSMSGKEKESQDQVHDKEHDSAAYTHEGSRDDQSSVGRTVESPGASAGEGSPKAFTPPEVSHEEGSHVGSGSSEGESENENTKSNDSSSGKDIHDLAQHEDEKGEVCPLRALSHIAHIKRKQDCMQDDFEQVQSLHGLDDTHELSDGIAHGSPSKKRRFKQVQFQLESLTYQKLTRLLVEQHQGSFQRFVMATLNSIVVQDKTETKTATITRKPAFSKWKRTRFDQLKGTETQELAIAFRSLAEAMPNVEVPSELMHTPWQELNMLQIQKMLEETKKMLLVNEKVHDCPYTDCGRRFSTPGNLKDHLNEHSGEQPYSCSFEDCPHRFRSKQHLCRHMKKHERAHTCTFEGCNKRFAFRERLIVHQKIHSDERPLSCPWEGCGKTFKWANSLHGHMRTHTGEKPFQCTFAGCGRLFGYKVDLTRHRRTHFGQPARASH